MYTLSLEIINKCNLNCTYCYLGEKKNTYMSLETAQKARRIFMNDVKLENVELQEEEVNIYTPACGETRYKCIADCLMGNCFITCDY